MTPADSLHATYWDSKKAIALLWFGVFAGPVGWALDVGISYALVQWTCEMDHPNVLHLFSLLGLVFVAAGGAASYWCLARVPSDASNEGGGSADRSRFLAILGLALTAMSLALVIANAVPRFILSPCHQ